MIEVEHLTKAYNGRKAVDDISFRVEKGEILGFLGPNGAGKTTTMRILTCYMPATDGTARVAGFDVFENSLEVRKRIGYLPENPPLYPEMTVQSYLHFVAKIKGTPSAQRKTQVEDAMDRCSITDVRDRIIGKLSKGYKQRVVRPYGEFTERIRAIRALHEAAAKPVAAPVSKRKKTAP